MSKSEVMGKVLTCLVAMIDEDTTIDELEAYFDRTFDIIGDANYNGIIDVLELKRYMRLLYRVAHLVKESRNEK